MTTAEILKNVRRIEIKSRGLSNHIFAGEYHSAFKGRGMSFSEVREYVPGDDVKFIDWNVTARFNTPFVKVFEEERELIMMLLVDISTSALFGTQKRIKREIITEMAAVLSFSAITNNDKVGVIFFSDKVDKYIPPKKGKGHVLRIIRELLVLEPAKEGGETNVGEALQFFNNVIKKKTIAFVLSDFLSKPFEQPLQLAARRHDLLGVHVYDKHDRELPKLGLVNVLDSETGINTWVDTDDKGVRNAYAATFDKKNKYCTQTFRKCGAKLINVKTEEDYVKVLQNYFKGR